jgi:hypothetical protein
MDAIRSNAELDGRVVLLLERRRQSLGDRSAVTQRRDVQLNDGKDPSDGKEHNVFDPCIFE